MNAASFFSVKGRLVFYVSILTKISDTLKVGDRRRQFSNPHYLIAKRLYRIIKTIIYAILKQCSIYANMCNADTAIMLYCLEKI